MQQIWTSTPDGKGFFTNSKNFRELLAKYVLEKTKRVEVIESDYENPSWSHKQAHLNGYNAALKEILKLITD